MSIRESLRRWTGLLIALLAIAGSVTTHAPARALDGLLLTPATDGGSAVRAGDPGLRPTGGIAGPSQEFWHSAVRTTSSYSVTQISPESSSGHSGGTPGSHVAKVAAQVGIAISTVRPSSHLHAGWLARTGSLSSFATSLPPPHIA